MAELNRDDLTDKYDDIFADNSVMKHGPEVLRQFRDDVRDSFALVSEVGQSSTALGVFVTTFFSPTEWRLRLPVSFPRTQATIDRLLSFATAAKATPPASYSDTLSSRTKQVEGITADISGTQKMKVNPIAGVGGSNLVLQLLDSSDGNRVSQFGFVSGNAGEFYQFQKKDGSFYEMPWPATDKTITV